MALASECGAAADNLPDRERFALASQIRRAAVSIPTNIAEGYGRNGRAEHVHHVGIARGSLYELETPIEIAHLRGYLHPDVVARLGTQTREIAAMLTRLRLRLKAP